MKRFALLNLLLISVLISFAQKTEFKELSYSEFFQKIEEEKDSVFEFSDAIITYNPETDSLFEVTLEPTITMSIINDKPQKPIVIDKKIVLKNVHFMTIQKIGSSSDNAIVMKGVLNNIHFKNGFQLLQTLKVFFVNCVFEENLICKSDNVILESYERFEVASIDVLHSKLKNGADIEMDFSHEKIINRSIGCMSNEISSKRGEGDIGENFEIIGSNTSGIQLFKNCFSDIDDVALYAGGNEYLYIFENDFDQSFLTLFIQQPKGNKEVDISNNAINKPVVMNIDAVDPKYIISYSQFSEGIINRTTFFEFKREQIKELSFRINDSLANIYYENYLYENEKAFKSELGLRGMFYRFYKSKFDNDDANAVYVDMKNMETKRLSHIYQQNPSFKTYFTFKINQFLKVFSAYGTEPARAIIFSFYVILIFALIYLFFPNSWDSHGKHRIIHRYTFFMKYMNRNQGIHEVYLEEKQPELLAYEEFKNIINESSKSVPRFFKATALPLYKWSLSGTQLTASFLSHFDVLKGTWQEVPQNHRWWKVILLIGTFLIAILYDIMIKILNALMLSINTFTTLGFGEIPIKGLPRYLAIIQGFIGWFMLTIFSVSLISQLLN